MFWGPSDVTVERNSMRPFGRSPKRNEGFFCISDKRGEASGYLISFGPMIFKMKDMIL
jgi:hypothetical protein